MLCALLAWPLACVGPYERGERLYRLGDVAQALEAWDSVQERHADYERARGRLEIVEAEFERMLLRYEKQAEFFRSEERLAEALLYDRLAYKLDPSRTHLLRRVQTLARELDRLERKEYEALQHALKAGRLLQASRHAARLKHLDPFNPALQIDIRQVHAEVGAEVLRHLEAGKRDYAAGRRAKSRKIFQTVLDYDPTNEVALGYLSYLRRFETLEARRESPPLPHSISSEEILGEGHYRVASQAERAGEPFTALSEYEAALLADPKHSTARRKLARLRRELHPQIDELYEAGKRYFQDEDLHNALRVWRRVLLIDPTYARTRENIERAERILSRLEEIQTDGS